MRGFIHSLRTLQSGKMLLHLLLCLQVIVLGGSTQCGQVMDNKVTDADRLAIVNTHNHVRSMIAKGQVPGQPKGRDFKHMKWDENLARAAQKIANSCKFSHVKVNDKRFWVGQNLAWTGSTASVKGAQWRNVTMSWFEEHKDYKYPNNPDEKTGHYTQVVWADTRLVGCGYVFYHKSGNQWYEKLYVCNYGPGGNIVGRPPYST